MALLIVFAVLDCLFLYVVFLIIRGIYRFIERIFGNYHETQTAQDLRSISIKQPFIQSQPLLPYRKKSSLLTVAERNFYDVLKPVANEHNSEVFIKVRLEDLLTIPPYTRNTLKWRGYVRSRHIDFILCDRDRIKPLCAIELDDSSHDTERARKIDATKTQILDAAGLPLLRIRAAYSYDPNSLTQKIREAIGQKPTGVPIPTPYPIS